MNFKRDVTDEQSERHKRMLSQILRDEGNKNCADCRTRNPTWASVNLGVFVCLTCSGIHRSLGVHISQVRSCNLDTWLAKQVDFCKVMGNVKGNLYWEHRLPKDFRRPPSGNPNPELAAFIRDKYVDRRYAVPDMVPPTIENYTEHPYGLQGASDVSAASDGTARSSTPPPAPVQNAMTMDLLGGFDELAQTNSPARAAAPQSADPFDTFLGDSLPMASTVPAPPAAAAPVIVTLPPKVSHAPSNSRHSLEWTDFHAAPAAPPALAHTASGHQRSSSVSEGMAQKSSSKSHGPTGLSRVSKDPPAQAYHDPFSNMNDDLLAGLNIVHAAEHNSSSQADFGLHKAQHSQPHNFNATHPQPNSHIMPGNHQQKEKDHHHHKEKEHHSHHHKKHSAHAKSADEILKLFDATPSTASDGDPFGDFMGSSSTSAGGAFMSSSSSPYAQQGLNGVGVASGFGSLMHKF